ncbi:MAG TPA: hypothetical protein ENN31_01395 [Candidatus Vogelbacteria bacterium]|nr:hypothetical protein [Candidatus Vogelbacteria bacterium]
MKKLLYLSLPTLLLTPFAFVSAAGLDDVVDTIGNLISALIPIMLALAVVVFFWGLAMYLLKAGDEEGQKGARNLMIYGVIAIFVMVSLWGLVGILASTFGVEDESAPNIDWFQQ